MDWLTFLLGWTVGFLSLLCVIHGQFFQSILRVMPTREEAHRRELQRLEAQIKELQGAARGLEEAVASHTAVLAGIGAGHRMFSSSAASVPPLMDESIARAAAAVVSAAESTSSVRDSSSSAPSALVSPRKRQYLISMSAEEEVRRYSRRCGVSFLPVCNGLTRV